MFKRKLSADKLKKQTDKQIKVNFKQIVKKIDENILRASKDGLYNLKINAFEIRHKYFIYNYALMLAMMEVEYLDRGFDVGYARDWELIIAWDGKESEQ